MVVEENFFKLLQIKSDEQKKILKYRRLSIQLLVFNYYLINKCVKYKDDFFKIKGICFGKVTPTMQKSYNN